MVSNSLKGSGCCIYHPLWYYEALRLAHRCMLYRSEALGLEWSLDSALSQYTAKVTSWTIRGSNPGRDTRFLSSPNRSGRLWGPPNLVFNGYRCFLPGATAAGVCCWPLTAISPPSICLHSVDKGNFTILIARCKINKLLHLTFYPQRYIQI